MTLFHRLASILRWIARRDRADAALEDELQTYLEMSAAEKIRDGVPAGEARRLARIELGGLEQAKERVRSERHGHLISEVGRDVRYAIRMFTGHPGFSAVIMITLALGIGANAAIFGLIDALLLRSLPVPHAHELVLINLRDRADTAAGGDSFSLAIVRALDDRRDVFQGVGGFAGMDVDVGAPGSVRRIMAGFVTGGFYSTLGLVPAAGRLLRREDDRPGAPIVAVISDAYWETQYSRSATVIGQAILVNGKAAEIVGVTPHGFSGADVGSAPPITMAVSSLPQVRPNMAELLAPGNFWLRALARPAPHISVSDASARLNAAWPTMADVVIPPRWAASRRAAMAASLFVLEPGSTGWTYLRGIYRTPLYVLLALAGIVLLVACANIACLFLARASTRQHEIAVRLAIGAGRGRILRQLIIEGAIPSFAGALVGVGVAWVSDRFLVDLMSTGPFPVVLDLSPNWRVVSFAAALATATGIVFGLAPALQIRRRNPSLVLKNDTRTTTRRSRLLPGLVTLQIALSLVLVAGAGLFVRTLLNLQRLNLGFTKDDAFVVRLDRGTVPALDQLLDAVRAVPGVISAGVGTHTPLDGSSWSEAIMPAGQPIPETDNALIVGAGPRFLETMQVPLAGGRGFTAGDAAGAAPVAIVNERYAERYLPKQNPLGRHLVGTLMGRRVDLEIVGVVKNTAASSLRRVPAPIVYVPFAQFGDKQSPSLVIRAGGPTGSVAEAVRASLQRLLPTRPVELKPLAAQISGTILTERLMATLAGAFGVLALVLASVGLYGLLAYGVAQQFREIGIRMALGATAAGVVRHVLAGGGRLVLAGLVVGYPVVWVATKSIDSMLFGLNATDPAAMATATALLLGAAFLASYLPARRASRVDPLRALRDE